MVTRTHRLALVLVSLAAVFVAGCSGGQDDASAGSAEPTTTAAPASAQVTRLEAPVTVDCAGATSVTVAISFETSGAKSQQLLVDGNPIQGANVASGAFDVPIHCDPLPHTVAVVAKDPSGRSTAKSTTVATEHGAGT